MTTWKLLAATPLVFLTVSCSGPKNAATTTTTPTAAVAVTTTTPTTTRAQPTTTTQPPTTTVVRTLIRLTDPNEIAQALDAAAKELAGRGLPQDERQAFVDYYHHLETQAQTTAGAGGTVIIPDLQAEAQAFVNTRHPDLVTQNRELHAANLIRNAFASTTARP